MWNIAPEYLSLVIILILLMYSRKRLQTPNLKSAHFRMFLEFAFLEIILSIISVLAIENYTVVPESINQIIQIMFFLAAPILPLLFAQYVIAVGWEDNPKIRTYLRLAYIPYILYLPLVLSNHFTKLLYDITSLEGFVYGKWFSLIYQIHLVYIVIMFIIAFSCRKKMKSYLSNTLLSFPIISLIILIIESVYPSLVLSGSAAAVSSLIVYLYLLNKEHVDLKESEERFRDIFSLKGNPIFVIDKSNGDILEANESACSQYGYTRDEMLRLKNTDMSNEPERTIQAAKDFNGTNGHIGLRYHKKKDGDIFPVEINSTLFKWKSRDAILVISRDITERLIAENKLIYLSYHDQLTDLYNRRFFAAELERLDTKRNWPITVAMGDVNGLKLINDTFGHQKGDQLLKTISLVMQKACREDDIIARLGGDEFAVIFPNTTEEQAEKIVSRIIGYASQEEIEGLSVSISFGCQTKHNELENINTVMKEAEEIMYRNKLNESTSMRSKAIPLMMKTLFEKNVREMEHSERVSDICVRLASEMGLDRNSINRIRTAGLMHDIGKIGIDERILNSNAILTDVELIEIKRHSEIGYRILIASMDFSDIAEDVYEHHERWDGKGYPRGLREENISIFARIIAIADSFDAMVSDRPYRAYKKSMSEEEALEEIRNNSGTQFDPRLVQIFVEKVMHFDW